MNGILVLNICLLSAGVHCQGPTFAGHLFTAFQSGNNLTISAATIDPSGNTTYIDTVFPDVLLPSSTCGDRYSFCHVTTYYDMTGAGDSKMAAVAPAGSGAAVVLFDRQNVDLNFVSKMFVPLPTGSNCVLTAFIGDSPLYGLCYKLIPDNDLEVTLQVFLVLLDFQTLTTSVIIEHSISNPIVALSEPFAISDVGTIVYWYQDAFLYSLRIDIFSPLGLQDTNITQCFNNGTRQVTLFQDTSLTEDPSLLAYCEDSTVELSFSGNLVVNTTTFYCSRKRDTFLQVRDEDLYLIINSQVDYVIQFPRDLSLRYVGDCVEIDQKIFFIGSSSDGTITLTDVLGNKTTILTTSALVNHQVVDDRFVVYSGPTSSAILDLSCPEPSTPIHVSNVAFDLSAFFANEGFSCFSVQPTTPPTTVPTTGFTTNAGPLLSDGGIAGIVVAVVVVVLALGCIAAGWLIYQNRHSLKYKVTTACEQAGETVNLPVIECENGITVGEASPKPVTGTSSSDLASSHEQNDTFTQKVESSPEANEDEKSSGAAPFASQIPKLDPADEALSQRDELENPHHSAPGLSLISQPIPSSMSVRPEPAQDDKGKKEMVLMKSDSCGPPVFNNEMQQSETTIDSIDVTDPTNLLACREPGINLPWPCERSQTNSEREQNVVSPSNDTVTMNNDYPSTPSTPNNERTQMGQRSPP